MKAFIAIIAMASFAHSFSFSTRPLPHRMICALNLSESENTPVDDDDGWGDETAVKDDASSSSRISQSKELEMLQNEMARKSSGRSTTNPSAAGEKDLFIPTITIVSVLGFTGLYGYEMLRLYSRGELYLPWEN